MSTLTISVADYFNSEGQGGLTLAVGPSSTIQGNKGTGHHQYLSIGRSRPIVIKNASAPKSLVFLSDLDAFPDFPLLRSAPSHTGTLTGFSHMGATAKDDISTTALWVRMRPEPQSSKPVVEKFPAVVPFIASPTTFALPKAEPCADTGTIKISKKAAPPAAKTTPKPVAESKKAAPSKIDIPKLSAPVTVPKKAASAQKEYVSVDEVKQVIQAARPAWSTADVDAQLKTGSGSALRAAIAAKLAALFVEISGAKVPSSVMAAIPGNATSIASMPSPPPLPTLRKLKLSLKVSSLTKLYSTLNISPKLVRFATRIANVKTFDGRDSPCAVSVQNSPTDSPTNSFASPDYFSVRHNFTDLGFSDDDLSLSDLDMDVYQQYTKDKHYKITRSNFVAPKNIYDNRDSAVYLQQASLSSDRKLLVLLVMCQNLAYEKKLSVKLTLNNWNSVLIFNNYTYMKLFTSVNYDQFQFVIPFSHFPSSITPQFCIRYDVNNNTYWDNNASKNYSFSLTAIQEVKEPSSFFTSAKSATSSTTSNSFATASTRGGAFGDFSSNFGGLTYPGTKSTNASLKFIATTSSFSPSTTTSASGSANSIGSRSSLSASGNHYNELVNKLMVAKTEAEGNHSAGSGCLPRPSLLHAHSMSLIPSATSTTIPTTTGPRFSQSYLSKRAPEKLVSSLPSQSLTTSLPSAVTSVSSGVPPAHSTKWTPASVASAATVAAATPEVPRSASSSDFSNAKFNSSSYAALLATYCFNGADAMSSCPLESLTGSRASSSLSVNSDFMGPSLGAFHSLSDSFHV